MKGGERATGRPDFISLWSSSQVALLFEQTWRSGKCLLIRFHLRAQWTVLLASLVFTIVTGHWASASNSGCHVTPVVVVVIK